MSEYSEPTRCSCLFHWLNAVLLSSLAFPAFRRWPLGLSLDCAADFCCARWLGTHTWLALSCVELRKLAKFLRLRLITLTLISWRSYYLSLAAISSNPFLFCSFMLYSYCFHPHFYHELFFFFKYVIEEVRLFARKKVCGSLHVVLKCFASFTALFFLSIS